MTDFLLDNIDNAGLIWQFYLLMGGTLLLLVWYGLRNRVPGMVTALLLGIVTALIFTVSQVEGGYYAPVTMQLALAILGNPSEPPLHFLGLLLFSSVALSGLFIVVSFLFQKPPEQLAAADAAGMQRERGVQKNPE